MHRSLWNRTLSAIFAVWLALAMGDAGFAHPHCPMHDGPLPAAPSGSGMHTGGHASHGEHGAPGHGAPEHGAPENGGHHLCTCIGACSASAGAAAIAEPAELPAAVIAFVSGATPERDETRAPAGRAPFSLPFANGPPRRIA
jgi:hypothetical protein